MRFTRSLITSVLLVASLHLINAQSQSLSGSKSSRVLTDSGWVTGLTDAQVAKLDLKRIDCEECKAVVKQKDSTIKAQEAIISNKRTLVNNQVSISDKYKKNLDAQSEVLALTEANNKDLTSNNKKLGRTNKVVKVLLVVLSAFAILK